MILAGDWGSYLGPTGNIILPFAQLKDIGLECWIFKGGQEVDQPDMKLSTTKNMAAARAAGVALVGCYYWNDPLISAQNQIDTFSRLIDAEKPDIICIDIEQWWASWDAYMAYVNAKAPMASVPVKSPQAISENARWVCYGVHQRYPDMRLLPYTSKSFVTSWAAPISTWLGIYGDRWVASWPDYGKSPYYLSLEDLKAYPPAGSTPDLPAPWSNWTIWQTSSRIKPVEFQGTLFDHQYDWDLMNFETVDEMLSWAGKGPKVATLEERVAKLEAQARAHGWEV